MAGTQRLPLHTQMLMPRAGINRAFALLYSCAILALLYHHFIDLLQSTSMVSVFLLLADSVLAFMWVTAQAFRMYPTHRQEPPMSVVNTALSVMAYDYPTEKLSVYVSDDGGSKLTLFAFMEAARFAAHWLPYCRKNKVVERCPKAHFGSSNPSRFPETDQIKVLLEHGKDKDVTGHGMPNLVYISREKSTDSPHRFKAGALNVLLRVSATMTNAPVILTLDSDMYSNDPQTPLRALCYLLDPSMDPKLGYVQFPQVFHGINKNDIYGGELSHVFEVHMPGMDGLAGPIHVGSGGFFRRRVFYGCPSETLEMNRDRQVSHSIKSREVLAMAHHVAGCKYENQTEWGRKMGFRYGSLVEDLYTSCLLQCEGWKSIYCNPKRPAFLGKSPINLHDFLNQTMRWSVGLLEVAFSRYSPITFGSISLLSGYQILGVGYMWFFSLEPMDKTILSLYYPAGRQKVVEPSEGVDDEGTVEFHVVEEEQSKRYQQGIFEFGVPSPVFLPLTTAAIINLVAFLSGIAQAGRQRSIEDVFLQLFLAGFAVVNCWPVYEAMAWRRDQGNCL
ncbi:Cellulose synthase-like protein G1 [Vitis vinifera]|uniref:Cellulose synthase-like protein G1 n=1 Tax=Vitis vinifera TaxID=29760 RepID=A0A438I4E9_VITVI|nr:Cellulose synthase-like protein G1 [Vitis vinifera]